ncbi:hypothetical protein SESBI_27162 [Sesbania bispinosa]|nr:hypothetical protein SESBI_27162 [Sesbania bispinosa]
MLLQLGDREVHATALGGEGTRCREVGSRESGVGRRNSTARRWLQDGGEAFPKLSGGCCTGTCLVRGTRWRLGGQREDNGTRGETG